jgi:hypothetical protein
MTMNATSGSEEYDRISELVRLGVRYAKIDSPRIGNRGGVDGRTIYRLSAGGRRADEGRASLTFMTNASSQQSPICSSATCPASNLRLKKWTERHYPTLAQWDDLLRSFFSLGVYHQTGRRRNKDGTGSALGKRRISSSDA